jgi:rsbT antagonist protein RsbS
MDSAAAAVPLQLMRGCIVASIQVDLSPSIIELLRQDVLNYLQSSGARAVLLDLSGVELLGREEFEGVRSIIASATVMGAQTVVTGLRAEVVSVLVDLDVDSRSIVSARTVDDGLNLLRERGELS